MFSVRAIALVLFCSYISQSAQGADCALATNWSGGAAESYLEQPRDSQTGACTAAALYRLAKPDYSSNPVLLMQYIGFARPNRSGMFSVRLDNVADLYPAVRALVELGPSALPILIDFLKQPSGEDHRRRNAVRAIKLIHPDDPALPIERLLRAAATESGTKKEMLEQAATLAYQWCPDSERPKCELAYNRR